MTRLLICTAMFLALTASASAQSAGPWGSSYFGPMSSGNYYPGPPMTCAQSIARPCPKIEQPKALRTTGKKGR
jgi:hypothetical protein